MSNAEIRIASVRRLARHAELRLRLVRSLRAGVQGACAALLVAILGVALRKIGIVSEPAARGVLVACSASILVVMAIAWGWRLPERAGARALDRFHGLRDRLSSGLDFADRPLADRTAFMTAAIEDAIGAGSIVKPRRAVPIVVPRGAAFLAALAALFAVTMLFEVRKRVVVAHARTIDPLEVSADDLDDVKDFLRQMDRRDSSDETRAAVEEFNKLVDDLAGKRLDRTEAFRRMQALEERLLTGSAVDPKTLEQELERVGEELKKADLTRPAGVALAENKLAKARDGLQELARKLRAQAAPVDKAKLDQMREALKEAAAQAEKRRAELQQRREQLADEILKMKQKAADGGAADEEESLLRKQRELDRLDRELDQQREGNRQLDRLDRELEQAAEDLMKDLGMSAEDLEQGAEDLNRMDEQQMSQQEKEELRQKLEELRQLVRQQGQGGKPQLVRLQRFGRMARGAGGHGGSGGQQGQGQGQGQEGSDGQGQGGQSGSGQGRDGQGQGGDPSSGAGQGGETWIVGPNGEKLLLLSKGSGGSQSGGADSNGENGHPGRWGEGHDPKLQGQATNPKMGAQDTEVQGADSAQGGSRSQVILGAAERGFASHRYQKVYTEYHQVAEESLAKDEIPGGYRFYVKRYFQLIRPRETQ